MLYNYCSKLIFLSNIFNTYSQTAEEEMIMNLAPSNHCDFKIHTADPQHLVSEFLDLLSSDGPVLCPNSALHPYGCNLALIITNNCTPPELSISLEILWNSSSKTPILVKTLFLLLTCTRVTDKAGEKHTN